MHAVLRNMVIAAAAALAGQATVAQAHTHAHSAPAHLVQRSITPLNHDGLIRRQLPSQGMAEKIPPECQAACKRYIDIGNWCAGAGNIDVTTCGCKRDLIEAAQTCIDCSPKVLETGDGITGQQVLDNAKAQCGITDDDAGDGDDDDGEDGDEEHDCGEDEEWVPDEEGGEGEDEGEGEDVDSASTSSSSDATTTTDSASSSDSTSSDAVETGSDGNAALPIGGDGIGANAGAFDADTTRPGFVAASPSSSSSSAEEDDSESSEFGAASVTKQQHVLAVSVVFAALGLVYTL